MDIPAYTPYSQQERHQAIEAVLTASAETLQLPEVRRQLGHYAAGLAKVVDHATVPNIRNGEVVMDGRSANCVPVVAVHIGERVLRQSRDLVFNPSQKYAINKAYKSGVARDIFKHQAQFYEQGPSLLPVTPLATDTVLARVQTNTLLNANGAWPVHVYSRPLVQFNLDANHALSPVVALHEFTHVMQYNQKPIDYANKSLVPNELEAFYVTAKIIQGYRDADRHDELLRHTSQNNQDVALEVETIRHRHNGMITELQPFNASANLIEDLAVNQLPITPDIANLIDSRLEFTA